MHSEISIVYTGYRKFESDTKKNMGDVKTWKCVALNRMGIEAAFAFALDGIDYPLGSSACFRKDSYLYGCDKYEPLISTPYCAGDGTILNISMCMTGYFISFQKLWFHIGYYRIHFLILKKRKNLFCLPLNI